MKKLKVIIIETKYKLVINNSNELCNILKALIDLYGKDRNKEVKKAIIKLCEKYKYMIYSERTNNMVQTVYKSLGKDRVDVLKYFMHL